MTLKAVLVVLMLLLASPAWAASQLNWTHDGLDINGNVEPNPSHFEVYGCDGDVRQSAGGPGCDPNQAGFHLVATVGFGGQGSYSYVVTAAECRTGGMTFSLRAFDTFGNVLPTYTDNLFMDGDPANWPVCAGDTTPPSSPVSQAGS